MDLHDKKYLRSFLPLFAGNGNLILSDPNLMNAYTNLSFDSVPNANNLNDVKDSVNYAIRGSGSVPVNKLNNIDVSNIIDTGNSWQFIGDGVKSGVLQNITDYTIIGVSNFQDTAATGRINLVWKSYTNTTGVIFLMGRSYFSGSSQMSFQFSVDDGFGRVNSITTINTIPKGNYVYCVTSINMSNIINMYFAGLNLNSTHATITALINNLSHNSSWLGSSSLPADNLRGQLADQYFFNSVLSNSKINEYANFLKAKFNSIWIDI